MLVASSSGAGAGADPRAPRLLELSASRRYAEGVKAKATIWLVKNRKLILPALVIAAAAIIWFVWLR